MPTNTGRITAVILVYRQIESVRRVIEAVKAQSLLPTRIIVVDNGSDEKSAAQILVGHQDVELIRLPTNVGVGAGHNAGWRLALQDPDCEFIWSLEHDCFPHPDCLSKLVEVHRTLFPPGGDEFPGIVAPDEENERSRSSKPHYLMTAVRAHRLIHYAPTSPPVPNIGFTFNATLFPTTTVRKLGMLNEELFFYGEDGEYVERCRQHGIAIYLVPAARVEHDRFHGVKKWHTKRWVILLPGDSSAFRVYYGFRNKLIMSRKAKASQAKFYLRTLGGLAGMLVWDLCLGRARRQQFAAWFYGLRDGLQGRSGQADYWFL